MMAFASTVIRCTARYPKSTTFSGCPSAHAASVMPPWWPVSVDAVANPPSSNARICGTPIEPAKPPFPAPWNRPFHPELGIHPTNRISESPDGLITPATWHDAGRFPPAATASARVIVVSASASFARLAQSCAPNAALTNATKISPRAIMLLSFGLPNLLHQRRHHLEQIAHNAVIGHLENGRVLVLVDRHDGLRAFHPHQVLYGARDAHPHIELGH